MRAFRRIGAVVLCLALGWGGSVPPAAGRDGDDDAPPDDPDGWVSARVPVPEFVREDPLGGDPEGLEHLRPPPPPDPEAAPAPGPPPEPVAGPTPPAVPAREGEVLTAVAGVTEVAHDVALRLEDGLLRADVEMRFQNRSRLTAEVAYRLPVPKDAVLVAVEACLGDRCRAGRRAPGPGDAAWTAYDEAVRSRPPRDAEGPLRPVLRARIGPDRPPGRAGARAVHLAAAPLPPRGDDLRIRLSWLAPAPLRGGIVRRALPARGADPRVAPASYRVVAADGLLGATIADRAADRVPVVLDAWVGAELRARAPTAGRPRSGAIAFPCGDRTCGRAWLAAGPERGRTPRELVVLVDASPSTVGPARGRAAMAVTALLGAAPPGTRAEVWAFAARAERVVDAPMDAQDVPLRPLGDAAFRELGSATRFDAAWAAVGDGLIRRARQSGRAPLVVVVGDGGITPGPDAAAAFAAARRAGVEVAAIDLGDDPPHPALADGVAETGGAVVGAGALAERGVRDGREEALVAQLASVFSPKRLRRVRVRVPGGPILADLGPLPAGEERVWEGVLPAGARRFVLDPGPGRRVRSRPAGSAPVAEALADRLRGRRPLFLGLAAGDEVVAAPTAPPEARACPHPGPPRKPSGVSTDQAPVVLAQDCDALAGEDAAGEGGDGGGGDDLGRGVPSATVLGMLRQRVVPVARRCFRRDRAGRADYAVRAVFEFRLEDREVLDARVEGEITDALRRCLRDAVEQLLVPAFDGVVVVRYPVHTQREPPPRAIELTPTVAEELDRALGD